MTPAHEQVISRTRHWVDMVVVGLNLCPFARRELMNNRLHFAVSDAVTQEQLLMDLHQTLIEMSSTDTIETTLLIHPDVLEDFDDYNQFLDYADALISDMQLEGIFQVASFHPHYQFAGTQPQDARNYSNRSPFPMLHILREASVEKAVAGYPDADLIPEHNQALLESLGNAHLQHMLDGHKKP
jgi:hypothetical protein